MWLITKKVIPFSNWYKCRKYSTGQSVIKSHLAYTTEPQYPQIEEISFVNSLRKRRQIRNEKLKNLQTIEEKLIAINMPKYYGYKSLMLTDEYFPYNCLPLIQHCTRTVSKQTMELPLPPIEHPERFDALVKNVKTDIEDAIAFEFTGYMPNINKLHDPEISDCEKSRHRCGQLIEQINRVLLNALIADNQHLANVEIDVDPRHEAFWFVGGMDPPANVYKYRKSSKCQKHIANDPVDRGFQYIGRPLLTLRHRNPLKSIIDTNTNSTIPATFTFDPLTIGYNTDYRHGTTIPGFWPGSEQEFGFIGYMHCQNYMVHRERTYGLLNDHEEALLAHAMLSSFSWLFGQACYQGFSIFNDLTYPLLSQTILTNGQKWSFYLYQLNTAGIHCDVIDNNPLVNQCWGTPQMKLFEGIDANNGKIIGFNDDVLKLLVRFYTNVPEKRESINLKPYLNPQCTKVSDIDQQDRRIFLEERYKRLISNRPRARLLPEIYNWEKIYKIDHNTRPLDPKRRFFELGKNPWQRRLDEHTPKYVPKVLRQKKWEKFAKTYYPDI